MNLNALNFDKNFQDLAFFRTNFPKIFPNGVFQFEKNAKLFNLLVWLGSSDG